MQKNIFLAGLFHETHSFLDEVTSLSDFSKSGWGSGQDIGIAGSPMAAAIRRLEAAETGWYAGPYAYAMPSGPVADAVIGWWKAAFEEAWEANGNQAQAIFLVLHGAMVAETDYDVEASVVEWIRTLPGASQVPVYAVMDLHGNISPRFAGLMNGFLAYRENPHADGCEAAGRTVDLMLDAISRNIRHRVIWRGTNLIWTPSGTGTASRPMDGLEALARSSENIPGIAGVNVFAGYSYSDMPDTGVSFSVVIESDDAQDKAHQILDALEEQAVAMRAAGTPCADSVEDLKRLLAEKPEAPILVAEPSDNIGGGAPGDGTGLLRLFLELDLSSAGVIINDPLAVSSLRGTQTGSDVCLMIGGRGSQLDPGPVEIKGHLINWFKGCFELEDPRSHLASLSGSQVDMGDCAVIQTGGITILLTSRKTPPFDLGQWRVAGIQPEKFSVIGVKTAVAYRQAYDPIASAHLTLDTPGPCQLDLKSIPFRHVRRPVFPLDIA